MMKKNKPAESELTFYGIGEDDLVLVSGHRFRYSKSYDTGVVLRSANDNGLVKTVPYEWVTIARLFNDGKLEIDRGYYSERNAIERARSVKSFELPPEKVLRAKMVSHFIAQEEDVIEWRFEKCDRSDKDINRFFALFMSDKDNEELIKEAESSIARKGKKKLFVGPRQFRRLLARFEENELNPSALADRYPGGGSPGSTLSQSDLEFTLDFVNQARTPDMPTTLFAWEEMQRVNNQLLKDGKPGHRLVSLSTFQRMRSEASDFLNDVGKNDTKHRVERKYFFSKQGLQVTRPLEIVEMDEHQVHLMTMLVKNRIWDHLHPDAQVRIKALGRPWLSVALDAYSRSVVGMKLLKGAPDADAAVATLAMVAQQKDRISALLGAQTGWPQCGTPEAVHTDAGAGYVSAKFELAVMMFTGRHRIPPSRHPHLRGRVERFFRTINQRYIHLFSGQTFSNPLMKGDYDPEKYAHVTDEEFADLVARLIIDCYHNTKHRALGMTPLEAWYRGSQMAKGGILPPPSLRKYREIFGTTIKRSIGNKGLEIAGNVYSNDRLFEIRKKWHRAKLWIRMNEEDISVISVKHRRLNKWVEVPAVFPGLSGVTLDEWQEAIRLNERRFGKNRVLSQEKFEKGLAAAREVLALSRKRPGVILYDSLEKKLKQIEADHGATAKYVVERDYDYPAYDIGSYGEDDDSDDDEELAADRIKRNLKQNAQKERTVTRIDTQAKLNPGKGVESYDRTGFRELAPQSRTDSHQHKADARFETRGAKRSRSLPANEVSEPDALTAVGLPQEGGTELHAEIDTNKHRGRRTVVKLGGDGGK
ncbi:transposase [Rhizobium ruizarguesonis]|uniref:DDE-type integrase/transposase/recombinase n=1 Tax=Rhizobium ruizarguesonis TaxID=2081791 RepID=UPI0010309817|nr:DDE-type integrase/transposase/recombinase [Rhizobium ruizarguesonis]TAV21358.1 transposase [Rhizobium ruizarguesonis]